MSTHTNTDGRPADPDEGIDGHPWEDIEWESSPVSMGDGDTYGWYGTCRCGTRVVEWLVCDGAETVEEE